MKRGITNATEVAEKDPMGVIASSMLRGPSGAIEHMEAQGQQELVSTVTSDAGVTSCLLPAKCYEEDRAALRKAGVEFGNPVDGDPIFVHANLPKGWRLEATDHSMHNSLLDDKGRKRAGIFYKAAFYDRNASMNVVRRFTTPGEYRKNERREVVMDGKIVVFALPWRDTSGAYNREHDEADRAEAKAWLVERYPNFEDASAYWDVP